MLSLINNVVHLWRYKIDYVIADSEEARTVTDYLVSEEQLDSLKNMYPGATVTEIDQAGNGWINGMSFTSRDKAMEALEHGISYYKELKLSEVSQACNAIIISGCDVALSDGATEHFSLTETDQINLTAATAAIEQGASGYPYHADGQLCRLYSAQDIQAIGKAATAHKLYHTTYCNHLNMWIRRAESILVLNDISYGVVLPEDLAQNMAAIIAAVGGA